MKSLRFILIFIIGLSCALNCRSQGSSSGKFESYDLEEGVVTLNYENLISRIEFVNDGVIHISTTFLDELPLKHSYAVAYKKTIPNITITEDNGFLKIHSDDKEIKVDKEMYNMELHYANQIVFSFDIYQSEKEDGLKLIAQYNGERFFGLGEKTGDFELTGREFTMYNTDPIYASIPFYLGINNEYEYGVFFDCPAKSQFSMKRGKYYCIVDDETIDFYIFTGDVKKIIQDYTTLTGKPYFPPLWSFGFHQSRHSYTSQEEVLEIANNFKRYDIPIDAIYLDIGFMDNYLVFTYNQDKFPHPEDMTEKLSSMGIKTVAIVDPGVKIDKEYDVYQTGIENNVFCKYGNHYYEGTVWPGPCHFPDFTKESAVHWWGNLYKNLVDIGIEGFWNDMNEPSIFSEKTKTMPGEVIMDYNGIKSSHRYLHNIYGLAMIKASSEGIENLMLNKRIFLLSRAAYSGIQRYAFIWTGDNSSNWEHLKMNLSMVLDLGLSGVPYAGADIGGYTGNPSEEIFTRWIQLATFIPFMRDHTEKGSEPQEPYVFKNNINIIRKYIKMRYRLLPYLYTEVYKTHSSGLPIVKPLFLEHGKKYLNIDNEFLYGNSILIIPVLEKGLTHIEITLPENAWYDLWTDKLYRPGRYTIDISIGDIPVFVKEGTILPLYDFDIRSTLDLTNKRDLTLKIYPNKDGYADGFVYEDDGESFNYQDSIFSISKFNYQSNQTRAKLEIHIEGKLRIERKLTLVLPDNIEIIEINEKIYPVINRRVEVTPL